MKDIGTRLLAFVVIVAVLSGCTDRAPTKAKPKKTPAVVTTEDAAELYFKIYAAKASLAAAETAEKCRAGEFRDITAADEWFNDQTKAARLRANELFAAAVTTALADENGKPAKDVAPVYDQLAAGFSRVAGVTIKGETAKPKRASPSRQSGSR